MKTLNQNTENFLKAVKNNLDNSEWDYYFTDQGNSIDAQKACNYLNSQKFSIEVIKGELTEWWSGLVDNLRDQQITGEEKAKYAASYIASGLAQQRILKFIWNSNDGVDSSKWCPSLIEKTTFLLS